MLQLRLALLHDVLFFQEFLLLSLKLLFALLFSTQKTVLPPCCESLMRTASLTSVLRPSLSTGYFPHVQRDIGNHRLGTSGITVETGWKVKPVSMWATRLTAHSGWRASQDRLHTLLGSIIFFMVSFVMDFMWTMCFQTKVTKEMGAHFTSDVFDSPVSLYSCLVFFSLQHQKTSEMTVKCFSLTSVIPWPEMWFSWSFLLSYIWRLLVF